MRFRAELHRAARALASAPLAGDDPGLVYRAHRLRLAMVHDTTGAERRELAAQELAFCFTLLRAARWLDREDRQRRARAFWRALGGSSP
jgi:hypothetical protein